MGVEGYPTVSALVPAPAVPASVVAAASSVASSCVTLTYRVPRLPRERSECGGGLERTEVARALALVGGVCPACWVPVCAPDRM